MLALGIILLLISPLASCTGKGVSAQDGRAAGQGPGEQNCANLMTSVKQFPFKTEITIAHFYADGVAKADGIATDEKTPLPAHCLVQGVINARGRIDTVRYGDLFELRMPINWNGRFMFQGGGGTKGMLPPAVGVAGTATPTLAKGYAVVSNDGGHEDGRLAKPVAFGLDPQARLDFGYQTDDRTVQTAKFLINQFYGRMPDHSYHVGCSLGGQEGMQFSQRFPDYFDGIVAGAPVFDLGSISLSETNGLQAIAAISPKDANGAPEYYKSFSKNDQALLTRAILGACDKLDGLVDGVIDNRTACTFDPATFVFPETDQPLRCGGAKNDNCLSAAQIGAIKRINQGPRTSSGKPVVLPSGSTVVGYPYDGGFMEWTGIPSRLIGSETARPGHLNGRFATEQIPYLHFAKPDETYDAMKFNYDTDVQRMEKAAVVANSTDLSAFKSHGGKILYYHGVSDPGPLSINTINYYDSLAALNGGVAETQKFARLYLIPNMGHCRGGPATDQFDMLTPLVDWVEKGQAPAAIVASGSNFKTPPAKRRRPLCAYPMIAKYTGPAGGDIADAENYACQQP